MIKMLLPSGARSRGLNCFSFRVLAASVAAVATMYCQAIAFERIAPDSTTFKPNESMPSKCAGDGGNTSPEIHWSGAPPETKSFAVICYDSDAPNGHFVHWVVYDIPADVTSLSEGIDSQAGSKSFKQGTNSYKKQGWNGPLPPPGKMHHYVFSVYALKSMLGEMNRPTDDQLKGPLRNNLLGFGQMVGLYRK